MAFSSRKLNSSIDRIKFELAVSFLFFLRDHSALDNYARNVLRFRECTVAYLLQSLFPESWVVAAFPFRGTEEGYDFWIRIDDEWRTFINNFNL